MNPKIIVFADLDGTILDDKYDYTQVQPIIRKLMSLNSSIVLTSSKTRSEIEFYRKKLRLHEPFIVENGSAIIIPQGYFRVKYNATNQNQLYHVIQLGTDYFILRKKLALIQKRSNSKILGFGDMTIKEIAEDTGLPIDQASFSKKREYDEPFKIIEGSEVEVLRAIEAEGLAHTKGGRYFHLSGKTDKGKAVAVLKELYLREFRKIVTIGVGDSINDLPMLQSVNKPFKIDDQKNILPTWQEILEYAQAYASLANNA